MKNLTLEEKEKYQKLYESLCNDPKIKRMEAIKQHRGSNTYIHVCKVTKTAYKLAKHSIFKINFEDLITGAMLHDYFLYDWRVDRSKLKHHGSNHPKIALENAKRDFEITARVANIIASHMWPINFFSFHFFREAHIISLADKIVAIKEACTSKKYKLKHHKELEKLFVLED